VRDRAAMLDQCLRALGEHYPVIVVDDGSTVPDDVARVVTRHGATLVARDQAGGPAVARNAGLAQVDSEIVAFLDSDCVPPSGWIEQLVGHFDDPLVAAVAPRIVALPSETSAGRYAMVRSSLDLGEHEGRVVPLTRVGDVPTAALVVRRTALRDVSSGAGVFDPALRYGEDVDLAWRLHEAGWRIRYDPAVQVRHHEPETWIGLLTRRFHYGTSAASLAQRHADSIAPLVLQPWPAMAVAALLTRRRTCAAVACAASLRALCRTARSSGLPASWVVSALLTALRQTWIDAGRYGTEFAAPLLAVGLVMPCGSGTARGWRRASVAVLMLAGPLSTFVARRPALDPVRFTLGSIADEIAYGAGVWTGCARTRSFAAIRPRVVWRLFTSNHREGART